MRETKTTVLIGVPRLFQLLYDTIKRYVVQSPEAMEAPLDPATVEEIQAALGGHIRVLVSGGAALPDEVYDRFMEFGLTIYQGYGMTEASPVSKRKSSPQKQARNSWASSSGGTASDYQS